MEKVRAWQLQSLQDRRDQLDLPRQKEMNLVVPGGHFRISPGQVLGVSDGAGGRWAADPVLWPEPSPQGKLHVRALPGHPKDLGGEAGGPALVLRTQNPLLLRRSGSKGATDEGWISTAPPSQIYPLGLLGWEAAGLCPPPPWHGRSRMAAWAGMKESVSEGFCDSAPSPNIALYT